MVKSTRIGFRTQFFALLSVLLHMTDGFSFGAPPSTCWSRYPKHSHLPSQSTPCPFIIQLSNETYKPNQEISITISDVNSSGLTFAGVQIAAFRTEDGGRSANIGSEEIVGQFTQLSGTKTKAFSCFPGYKNMVTHTNKNPVSIIVLKWQAPDQNVGNLTFRATIVQNYATFWTNEKKMLFVDNEVQEPVIRSPYQVPMRSLFTDIDLSGCGETKGCLLYPRHCTGHDCLAAVSFLYKEETDNYDIEMLSSANDNYISVALSSDEFMGADETMSCVAESGIMSIQHGRNPAYYNEMLLNQHLSDMEIKQNDGLLQCRFTLTRRSQVYVIDQNAPGPSLTYNNQTFDLNDRWFLQLAWGPSMPATTVMTHHHEMPASSTEKILMKEIALHRGSAYPILVQVHVAVMMVAWILLSGIVTVISRHFKDWLPSKKIGGTKVWFQVHRTLAILIAVLTGVGLAVIFFHYGTDELRKEALPHAYVGIAVAAAVGVQCIAGFMRPGPDSKIRPLFNWGHRFLGQSSHILAAASMFLAFDIKYVAKDMRTFGYITLSVWVGVQLLWHLLFEMLKYRRNSRSFDFDSQKVGMGESKLDSVYLAVYIICLTGSCVAALLSFLLY